MKNILITGISGQDGLFLTTKLLNQNEKVKIYGTSRNPSISFFNKLNTLVNDEKFNDIEIIKIDLNNFSNVQNLINDIKPNAVYNFSGPSSVYKSLKDRKNTSNQIISIFDNLTEALIKSNQFPKFFQASSSEMFGNNPSNFLDERSEFNPRSPYAVSKLQNHYRVLELNEKYNWPIKSGILFNHESEFRDNDYLVMQLISSALKIQKKELNSFEVGSLSYIRDWSFAGDTIDAIYKITNEGSQSSYVIGTGVEKSIQDMATTIFSYFDLDLYEFIKINKNLLRKGDPVRVVANPNKLKNELSWEPKLQFEDLIHRCIKRRIDYLE